MCVSLHNIYRLSLEKEQRENTKQTRTYIHEDRSTTRRKTRGKISRQIPIELWMCSDCICCKMHTNNANEPNAGSVICYWRSNNKNKMLYWEDEQMKNTEIAKESEGPPMILHFNIRHLVCAVCFHATAVPALSFAKWVFWLGPNRSIVCARCILPVRWHSTVLFCCFFFFVCSLLIHL